MPDPIDHDAVHHLRAEPDPNDRHRLAACAAGNGGNVGKHPRDPALDVPVGAVSPEEMLATLRAAATELFRRSARGSTAEEVRAWAQQAAAVRRRVVDLADAYEQALLEEAAGVVLARRIERMTRPHAKRIETERRRAEGGMYVGEKRSPNRPTQVEVDPGAWMVVKAHAVRNRKALAAVVGKLVVQSFDRSLGSLVQESGESRPAPPDSAPRPRPERRFARLFVDDETWLRFRERAVEEELGVARFVGIVVEDEARVLGWRPSHEVR